MLTIDELSVILDSLGFANKEGVLNPNYDYLIEKIEGLMSQRKEWI